MFEIVSSFARTASLVTASPIGRELLWIPSSENARRVASMLSTMNGSSRWNSCGVTRNRWTNAGYAAPAMIETSASRPTAMTGSAHPRSRMLTRNRIAHAIAITTRIRSAGSCAFTSV